MPKGNTKRTIGFFLGACCGILIAGSTSAIAEFSVADAISAPCIPARAYDGSHDKWMSRDFPTEIRVDIAPSKQRAWIENLLRTLTARTENIPPSAKKEFAATVSWEFDGHRCDHEAEVRINGDMRDHISYQGSTVITSIAVKLSTGNIGHIVRFKLLLPETRAGQNEILAILLYRELGFLAPETRLVTGYLNGTKTSYLFQESPAKEFMEANNLRESLLIEGDERWRWAVQSRPDVYSDRLLSETPRVENRSFSRADNRGWLDNPTSQMIAVAGLTAVNRLYHQYQIDKPSRTGAESHLGMTSSYRLRQNSESIRSESLYVLLAKVLYSSHALRVHNRKFYYDPTYQDLIPIYYDGMALRSEDNLDARFPNDGTFPAHEIDLVANRLGDQEVQDRVYSGLIERGGTMSRAEFDELMATVVARAQALEPRPSDPADEPPPFEDLDLLLLLSEEEGDFEFYGFNVTTGQFELCSAPQGLASGHLPTCILATAEAKDLLSEPVAENGDPIPFVGAFVRSDSGGFSLRRPNARETRTLLNPTSLDLAIAAEELLIVDFDERFPTSESPRYDLRIGASESSAGKVIVRGKVPKGAQFSVTGNADGSIGDTRYDERLLTGCLTFIDAVLDGARIHAENVPCEDSINFVRANGQVSSVSIESAVADAIDADFSDLRFDHVEITAAANDCIDLSAGRYRVTHLISNGCGDKGLSVGEKAVVSIDLLDARDAVFGAVAKDSSYLYLDRAEFSNVDICFAAYRKKQEFGGARIEYSDSVSELCAGDRRQIQEGSVVAVAEQRAGQ